MGKLEYDQSIEHFSHEHPLELFKIKELPQNFPSTCSGCNLSCSDWIYTCKACKYVLHILCSQVPQLLHHPADPNHALTLISTPADQRDGILCDACGEHPNGFRYNCSTCNLDFHILCAAMPPSLRHQAHPHSLNLAFNPPYQTKGFSCDICQKLGSNRWLYRCNACDFDVHLNCATTKPRVSEIQHQIRVPQTQPPLQNHNSFPGGTYKHQFQQPSDSVRNASQQPNQRVYNPSESSTLEETKNMVEVGRRCDESTSSGNDNNEKCVDASILKNLSKYSSDS
ncbi:hypothetical protein IFM89_021694 [Coptis chinensis]|uniref:DC1 domain-containing protein n=1 Tax=Coptis chinensis TaxID=261450 RepID=A0A835IX34_9MAGN|nr:hypothetical protein IFM89_021694 [Coptis chinensis]